MTRARDVATQGGLVLLNTTSFSSVASITISNIFSSTYKNYRCIIDVTGAGSSGYTALQFTSGGTANSTSNYFWGYKGVRSGTVDYQSTAVSETSALFFELNPSNGCGGTFDIQNPFETIKTTVNGLFTSVNSSGNYIFTLNGVNFNATTSFDGIKISVYTSGGSANTFTGTIKAYGYR